MIGRAPVLGTLIPVMVIVVLAGAAPGTAAEPNRALLVPSLADAQAPETFKVKVETTSGDFVIEVHRDWAPNGADRFYNLVKIGYYDDTAFFRVIDGFMAQVGMNGDPKVQAAWSRVPIQDDPIRKENTRGMVTFAAKASPNSRTTQFFINYGDNTRLRQHGTFAPFGKVIEGMSVVDNLYSGYGEGAPSGGGPSQAKIIREGNSYLKQEFPKLDYIISTTVVDQ
jgi:peptidyl-prolyl cis-trans isomerase A (cyclophilin A)